MNSTYFNYFLFQKEAIAPSDIEKCVTDYDRLISTYNTSQRVQEVFARANAVEKHWLNVKEYGIHVVDGRLTGSVFEASSFDESDVIQDYFDNFPLNTGERLCVDSTGFVRPHLLFLLRYLFENGVQEVDVIYSEPIKYVRGSTTKFASEVSAVRQVLGFQGSHNPDTDGEGEYLIIGCGYDINSMIAVAQDRYQAVKVQLFPFPALRPHMYQENRLRTEACQSAFGNVMEQLFAPAYDPFATAQGLSKFYNDNRATIRNLYLSPLATKPQVIGFGLFYLGECLNEPVSVIFPFSEGYNQETSVGISELWRYRVDFKRLSEISHAAI